MSARDALGQTSLHEAIGRMDQEVVEPLISKGADRSAEHWRRFTPRSAPEKLLQAL